MPSSRALRVLSSVIALTVVSAPLVSCGPPKRKAPPLRTTIPDPLAEEGARREIQGVMAGPGADLSGMDLTREDLSGLDLSGANLSGAKLGRAFLSRSTFVGANLRGADIAATNAYRANFTGTKKSRDRKITNMILENIEIMVTHPKKSLSAAIARKK